MKPLAFLLLALSIAGAAPQRPQDARNAGTRVDVAATSSEGRGLPPSVAALRGAPVAAPIPGRTLAIGGQPSFGAGGGSPSAQPMSVRTGNSGGIGSALIGGYATYYADPKQPANARYAAAGPLLREALGDWRGKVIAITSGRHSTIVQLVDVCACGERQGLPTILDLSPTAFKDLAPLSAGVIRVEIELVTLPATDMED